MDKEYVLQSAHTSEIVATYSDRETAEQARYQLGQSDGDWSWRVRFQRKA